MNPTPSVEAHKRAVELGLRRRAQRNIVLGEWLDQNETSLRVIQSTMADAFFAHLEDEKSSEECWDDCMEAVELFIEVIASMRSAIRSSYTPHTACLKALTLTNKHACEEHRTSELLLPEVKLPGASMEAEGN